MTNRHVALLGVTTLAAALWNVLPTLKGSMSGDPFMQDWVLSDGSQESGRVLDLTRDNFASLPASAIDSSQPRDSSWSPRWTTPAWGDVPDRAGRAGSGALGRLKRLQLTGGEFVAIVLGGWWSLCAVYALRSWLANETR